MKKSEVMVLIFGAAASVFVFVTSARCFWDHRLVPGIITMVLGIFDIIMMVRMVYVIKHTKDCLLCLEKVFVGVLETKNESTDR